MFGRTTETGKQLEELLAKTDNLKTIEGLVGIAIGKYSNIMYHFKNEGINA